MASYAYLLKKAELARALETMQHQRTIADRKAELTRDLDALVGRGLLRKLPDGRYDLPDEFKSAS